jgi:fumarate reductase flavoprotein subunit
VYDARLHALGLDFEDYRDAERAGAVLRADSVAALAEATGLPVDALGASIGDTHLRAVDGFGRDFSRTAGLEAPYYAVRVTGALFHTQGGLPVNGEARVLDAHGEALPNLFAGGGAACGLSGAHVWGYLSGNGLLSAVTLGRIAGRAAALQTRPPAD